MQPDLAVIEGWRSVAPFWEKHRDVIRQMFGPVTEALVGDASVVNGHTVLDIATGPGEPALSIATLVGPQGKVVGIDPVPEMVAAARRAASDQGLVNAQFDVAHADDLPFQADTFDAVVSRFGVMFVPSPINAVRDMLRVLKPGGKLALAVWHTAKTNPFFYTLSQAIEPYVDLRPSGPDDPDAFRFATPGKLRDVLVEAGAAEPSERVLPFNIEAPLSPEEFWTLRGEMSEKLRDKIALLSPEQLAEVKHQTIEGFRAYSTAGGMSIPAEVVIVSGTKR